MLTENLSNEITLILSILTPYHCAYRNNCGHYVAYAMNCMKFKDYSDYSLSSILLWTIVKSRYVSCVDAIKTYLPILIIMLIIVIIIALARIGHY